VSPLRSFWRNLTRHEAVERELDEEMRSTSDLVLRQGMTLVTIGSITGLALGFGAGTLLSKRQFGIPQFDPLVLVSAVLFFPAVGLIACYIPVRRATTIRAVEALRSE